ncbi:MAG: CYTH domain-containing protein [Lachnospiraceae bacterium]|nr:CYTH domain-containing protein [Lachnospiraceae bacterium]MBQ9934653.1 CYTH domain-containing protein [Lachnospiraceae bacterium]
MEIERKFLIKKCSFELSKYDYVEIQQAYISTSPVIRVRKRCSSLGQEEYILTVKSKGMLSRQEFELSLEPADYERLLTKAEGNIITKRRYIIPLCDGLTLELDYFQDLFQGLIMGEIEFSNEAEAKKYNLPDFVLKEVTFDKRYHNSNMSLMPKEDILDLISLSH